ncbi:MAG TPA: sensor histidine kinase [Terracidiphilus sp.]|nr:sensor histidine kinase [Terracidiphilus sp.]
MQTASTMFNNEAERRRVRAVVETLAGTRQPGHSAAEVAHDARNMVTALELYSDLLSEPGVLTPDFLHYANELKLVASASRRLVEKLMVLDGRAANEEDEPEAPAWLHPVPASQAAPLLAQRLPGDPIDNLAREVEANRDLLDAIAGMSIPVTVKTEGGAQPVRLTAEDLTRVLVNLVKNAAEAMRGAGRIEIALREGKAGNGAPELVLTVDDSGPGIREGLLDRVFEPGFTTHAGGEAEAGWPAAHRGLGLSITRSIVDAAGGRVHARNRSEGGARIVIELPAYPR